MTPFLGPSVENGPSENAVAVAIAMKRRRDAERRRRRGRRRSNQSQHLSPARGWWKDLSYGLALYLLCLILPSLWGILVRLYEAQEIPARVGRLMLPLKLYWMKHVMEPLGGHVADPRWTDLGIVLVFSLSFATLRIALVHWLVELQSPTQLRNLVRNKSIHLLSSTYSQTLTPSSSGRKTIKTIDLKQRMPPIPPSVTLDFPSLHNLEGSGTSPLQPRSSTLKLDSLEGNDKVKDAPSGMHNIFASPREDSFDFCIESPDEGREQPMPSPPSSSRLLLAAARQLQQETQSNPKVLQEKEMPLKDEQTWLASTWNAVRRSSHTALGMDNTSVAPQRFATAVFRVVYCVISVASACFWFQRTRFWPPAVGGHGSTIHCWDLKGAVGMDEDFDQANFVLKCYFWMQASYHLHSLAFHMWTMVLWSRNHQFSLLVQGRSLLQHCMALLLICCAHAFASTRRLGAIGSFALDVSSLGLHLLQMALNCSYVSPFWTLWLHRVVVIPVFCYARFYVWPFVVWRSAVVESKDWLQSMEQTLFPLVAQAMMMLFHLLTLTLLVLNVILLKRLIRHPHLQRVLREQEGGWS